MKYLKMKRTWALAAVMATAIGFPQFAPVFSAAGEAVSTDTTTEEMSAKED